MTTVIAVPPDCVSMAPRFFGAHFKSSRIVDGRGYVLVNGDLGRLMRLVDDGDLLFEAMTFPTMDDANAWIADDIAQRRRPS